MSLMFLSLAIAAAPAMQQYDEAAAAQAACLDPGVRQQVAEAIGTWSQRYAFARVLIGPDGRLGSLSPPTIVRRGFRYALCQASYRLVKAAASPSSPSYVVGIPRVTFQVTGSSPADYIVLLSDLPFSLDGSDEQAAALIARFTVNGRPYADVLRENQQRLASRVNTTPLIGPTQRATSTDQRYTATILANGPGDDNGGGAQALVVIDQTGQQRRLLISRYSEDNSQNLANLTRPLFSLDGNFVYFTSTSDSPNSTAVHQMSVDTGIVRFVCNGDALRVMRTGPYSGYLLVQVHRYRNRPSGGSYNPVQLVRPDGHIEFTVPGSEIDNGERAIGPWLSHMGWRAS